MSFLLNGTNLPRPLGEMVPPSARQSAAEVVAALEELRDVCDDRKGLCGAARTAIGFTGERIAALKETFWSGPHRR